MYDLNINLRIKNDKTRELIYADWEKQLGNSLIQFAKSHKVTSLKDLIYKFFYERLTTYYVDKYTLQCVSNKRRSLIDFYQIQRYYLSNPLSMANCADIYFNRLGRQIPRYVKNLKDTHIKEEHINTIVNTNFVYFYCPTVCRNVFRTSNEWLDLDHNHNSLKHQYVYFDLNQFDEYEFNINNAIKVKKEMKEELKTFPLVIPKLVDHFSYKTYKQIANQKLVKKVPCLSINDILNNTNPITNYFKDKLKELVKSKL